MNAVLLLSGGLDSQVLLAHVQHKYDSIHCVAFDYGQKHKRELSHAREIAACYNRSFSIMAIPSLRGSALTGDGEVPRGLHFADHRQAVTVVPNRNAIMLSMAAAVASQRGATVVLFAAHKGDSYVYPDCRPDFVAAISEALRFGCGVSVLAPFLDIDKRGIIEESRRLNVPIKMSWSCYEGGETPCGECGACIERREALL